MTGQHPYLKHDYVAALDREGRPLAVPSWGGWILQRPIDGAGYDGAGPYPMTPLPGEAAIAEGLTTCREAGLVSLVLVADPLCSPSADILSRAFSHSRAFKTHYLVDPESGVFEPSKHHRDRIRRGRRRCRVEEVALGDYLERWEGLYCGLVERRGITGAANLSHQYFDALSREPALRSFAAFVEDELVAMTLWFGNGGVAYNHLTASNASGYANGANFALYAQAIEAFEGHAINLGGCAGARDMVDGLAAFKLGFSNRSAQAYLCGSVLDAARYAALSPSAPSGFFPAYRG